MICLPTSRPMCCDIASPVSPPIWAITSRRSPSLLGHKTHSITSRYMHSADAVLLAAADAVANATMKLMGPGLASDQAQPQLRISSEMDQSCGTNLPLYRCFRPTEIAALNPPRMLRYADKQVSRPAELAKG